MAGIGTVVALIKALGGGLPQATPEDAGEVLMVGEDGSWIPGAATTATISASLVDGDDYRITVQEGSD